MFRELTRYKQALSIEECEEILENELRGVLAVKGDDDYPYAFPMNHYYDKKNHCIYFHSGKRGHKIDSIHRFNKASFCVYDQGYIKENEWALNVKSVIVFGKLEIIENDYDLIKDISIQLSHKFTHDDNYIQKEIDNSLNATALIKLSIEHISGKLVNES